MSARRAAQAEETIRKRGAREHAAGPRFLGRLRERELAPVTARDQRPEGGRT